MHRTRFQSHWLIAGLLLSTLTGCLAPQAQREQQLAERLDTILHRHDDTGAIVSARVLVLPEGRQIFAQEIDRPMTPASNTKLLISSAGLDFFGPDHAFDTYLAMDGDDLWVIGTGDPGIGDPRLAAQRKQKPTAVFDTWANALIARGITHIPGKVYFYDGALDDEWLHDSWGNGILFWYGAPIGGLNFNDNCVDISVKPTQEGQPVTYEVMPPIEDIRVINECMTGQKQDPNIVKLPDGNVYKLIRTCAKPASLKSKPVEDPGEFFVDAMRTHFASRGITIDGASERVDAPLDGVIPPPVDKLIARNATPMPDVLSRINVNSQNFFAEALCKLTGKAFAARQGREEPGSWANGGEAIRAFLRANEIDDQQLVVVDGSGLSPLDKVTTRMLSDLLLRMFQHPDAGVFRDSLAKGGVDGTLKARFKDLPFRVFAKTGYIGGVRSLSGYVRADGGEWFIFSIIYNDIPGSVKPYEKLQDEAVRLLAHWPDVDADVSPPK